MWPVFNTSLPIADQILSCLLENWRSYLIIAVQILDWASAVRLPEKNPLFVFSWSFFCMPSRAEQGGIDRVFAHAPNAGAAPVSNRFAVSAPAGSEPRSQIANNGATGGEGENTFMISG